MNKKGFTLIELMISIALLSIVLIFMMNTLVKLRDTNIAEGVETNLMVTQAIVGNTINTDLLQNGKISSYTLNNNNLSIELIYTNSSDKRMITITNNKKTLKYFKCGADNICQNTDDDILLNKTISGTYKFKSITTSQGNDLKKISINISDSEENIEAKFTIDILSYTLN